MKRFAPTSLYRSLTCHRFYAALNIGGLAVGIAVFLVLALYVRFETGYERWLPARKARSGHGPGPRRNERRVRWSGHSR